MNTAKLQLEGLLLALSAICQTLRQSGALADTEIEEALGAAESAAEARCTTSSLSKANLDAVGFPIRFLKTALQSDSEELDFSAIAAEVGKTKPARS
jgi:hypothetical protein